MSGGLAGLPSRFLKIRFFLKPFYQPWDGFGSSFSDITGMLGYVAIPPTIYGYQVCFLYILVHFKGLVK